MRTDRGQATVEHVAIVLVVAVLVGAIAGAMTTGAAGGLGTAVADAITRAIGWTHDRGEALPQPTLEELSRYALAIDPSVPEDERPTLRDVRLEMEARLGVEQGDALWNRLAYDQALSLLPDSHGPHRYRGFIDLAPGDWTFEPVTDGIIDVESPKGPVTTHVVRATEASAWLAHKLHPGFDFSGAIVDGALGTAALVAPESAAVPIGLAALAKVVGDRAGEAIEALHVDAALPPMAREGDVVACWVVERRRDAAHKPEPLPLGVKHFVGPVRTYKHVAVVRDGVVIAQTLVPSDLTPSTTEPGEASCNFT
jgi:hypothetical protein